MFIQAEKMKRPKIWSSPVILENSSVYNLLFRKYSDIIIFSLYLDSPETGDFEH